MGIFFKVQLSFGSSNGQCREVSASGLTLRGKVTQGDPSLAGWLRAGLETRRMASAKQGL